MRTRHASLMIITATLATIGCSSDSEPAAEPPPASTDAPASEPTDAAAPTPATGEPTITIEGFAFSTPDPVAPGTDITVANLDGTQHTLTADDGSFNTGGLDGGDTIVITAPDAPGTYTFLCNIHPSMTGSLTVEA